MLTMSVMKADIGAFVEHSASRHAAVLAAARRALV